jgi:hypothetical protein
VSPVKYELGFYISEGGILQSDRRKIIKSYICYSSPILTQKWCPQFLVKSAGIKLHENPFRRFGAVAFRQAHICTSDRVTSWRCRSESDKW